MPEHDLDSKSLIDGFIRSRVADHSLDWRTEKAYRLDLEHFYTWAKQRNVEQKGAEGSSGKAKQGSAKAMNSWEDWMEAYLNYLNREKKLSFSTIYRTNKVLGYYLSYLVKQGVISGCRSLKAIEGLEEKKPEPSRNLLSRREADAFFEAMRREYEGMDNEFRRRLCLRDMVMMELLFYHRIEISELLRLEVGDYDQEAGTLTIRRKRGKDFTVRLFSQELQRKMGLWLEERKRFRREGEYEDQLFLSKLGKPLSMEMFIRIFDKYRRLAGIEKKLTPKDLKENCMKQYARELVMEKWG